jgi:hypothetical protein
MKLTLRDLGFAAVIVSIVGGIGLVYDWYQNRPRFAIEQTQLVLEALPTGQEQEAVYRIHNLTGNVMRIVGAESG